MTSLSCFCSVLFRYVQEVPGIFYSNSNGIKSYFTINNVTSVRILVNVSDVTDIAYDSLNGLLYYHISSDRKFYSVKLDGSDLSFVAEISDVEKFTVDGKRNIIYYIHARTKKIHFVNLTNAQSNDVEALTSATDASDLDMDTNAG